MPAPKTSRSAQRYDQFPNFYKTTAFNTVADTIAFTEWNTGYSIKDGYGFIIHKITYKPLLATCSGLNAGQDRLICGLATRNDLLQADFETQVNAAVLDGMVFGVLEATAVSRTPPFEPRVTHDFTNEPGGGRIIAPKPLYLAVTSAGLGATYTTAFEIVYTMIKLTQEAYRELYESMNPNA